MAGDKTVKTVLQWTVDNQSLARTQAATKSVGDAITLQAQRATSRNQELAASFTTVARSADKAALSATTAARAASSGALQTARGAAGAAGGVLATAGLGQAGAAAGSLLALTSTLGPLGLVAGAATVGLGLLNAEAERLAKSSRDAANELKERAELVASGATTADIETQVNRLKAAQAFIDDNLARLTHTYKDLEELEDIAFSGGEKSDEARAGMTSLFESVSAFTGLDITEFATLHQHIQDVTADSKDYSDQILELSTLMRSGALEANNAAAAQEKLADAQKESAKAAEQAAEVRSKALQTQNAQAIALITDETNARQRLFEVEAAIVETIGERNAAVLAAEQERDAQIAELTEEGGARRAEIIADSEARIAKITRDSGQTLRNLTAERDALGASLEKQRLATTVSDEKEAGAKALAAQTVAEAKSIAQQAKTYEKSIAAQVTAGDKTLATLYEQKRREEFAVYNSQQAQLAAAQIGMAGVVNTVATGWQQVQRLTVEAFNNMVSWSNTRTGFGASGYVNTPPQTLSSTYPGGPSQKQVLDKHFDQRFAQVINAAKGGGRGAF